MILKKVLLFLLFLMLNAQLFAQKIEFGLGAGISHFKGDVSPNFNPLQIGLGGNGLFRYNLSRSVSLRGQLLFTSYNAKDENTVDPFFAYRNKVADGNIFESSALIEYNFLDREKLLKKSDWSPYLFGGIGYSMINNKSNFLEPQKANTLLLPYGVGVKYRFKGPFSICAEFGTRYTYSDNLDAFSFLNTSTGVKTTYFGSTNNTTGNITNDKISFGNTTRKDQYYFTNITLTYTIFKLVCPE